MYERVKGLRKAPGTEGITSKANNRADRPGVILTDVNGAGRRIVTERVVSPVEFRVVGGYTIGGGTSPEALRRARRR